MTEKFLSQAYSAPEDTRDLYAAWAKSYDDELSNNGYVTPERCANALAKHSVSLAAPILDFGCGTRLTSPASALTQTSM